MLKFLQKLFFIVIVFIGFAAQCQGGSADPVSAIKSGDSIDRTLVVPETNGVTIHNVFESSNFQKFMNYFAPYLGVLAINFAAMLAHEMGHNVVNLAGNKEWSKIWVGEHGLTIFSFDKDPRLDKQKWDSYFVDHDPRDAYLTIPDNAQGKWILEVLNDDKLFNNNWISIYKPDENLGFNAFIKGRISDDKYLNATLFWMGPAFGALFSWFMLHSVRQPHLEYAAKLGLLLNLVIGIFLKGTDGEMALKVLNIPTGWMEEAGQLELPLAQSAFNLVNFEQIIDIAMFSKAFQSKTEVHRMIALMGQAAFKVMIPLVMHYIREIINNFIDGTDRFIKYVEDQAYYWNDRKISSMFNFLRNYVTIAIPIALVLLCVPQNVNTPFAKYLTQYF